MNDGNDPVRAGTTRRQFLKTTAAGAVMLGSGLALPAIAQGGRRGGHLQIAATGGGAGDTLDPRTLSGIYHGNIAYLYGNCLTEIGAGNELLPELAESWEAADGGRRWTFTLRDGVTFHNGKPLTADDVVWSIDIHRGADTKSGAKALLASVTALKADGPRTVVVELDAPNADLPYVMSDFHLIILPAGTTDFDAGIGTGPYMVKTFEPGVRVHGVRNPNYFKPDRAWADEVTLLSVGDAAARQSALLTGEVHLIERVDSKTVALLSKSPGVQVFRSAGGGHKPILMLCDEAPFDNADLRMALKLAIDREDYLKRVLGGLGRIGNDHPIAETDPFFSKDIPQRVYDPDKAAFHYKRSGHSGKLMLSAADAAFAEAVDGATLFAEHAKKAGIDIEVVREPNDGYWSNVWRKKPFCMGSWGGRPTTDIMLTTAYKSDAPWNDTHWKNEQFDKLLLEARGELDMAKRKALYHECQLLIHETGGALIPLFNDFVDAARDTVQGFFPGNYALSGMRAAERCWLSA